MRAGMDNPMRKVAMAPPVRRGWGFTLIELLTIIVILGMLITLTTPSILEVKKIFATKESTGRMHLLEGAIRAYSIDWGVLPPSAAASYPKGLKGRQGLVQALTGYLDRQADGKDGWGSRKVARGKIYGPYVGMDQPMPMQGDPPVFTDAFGNDFYYYRFNSTVGVYAYEENDNDVDTALGKVPDLNTKYLRPRQDSAKPMYRVDYILLTPGADRAWETFPEGKKKSDDIVNFEFQFK